MGARCSSSAVVVLFVFAVFTLACGGTPSSQADRSIQSITVRPTTADAQTFPGGQVQFTATGYYNTQPSPVTPLSENLWNDTDSVATRPVLPRAQSLRACLLGLSLRTPL